jgi:hypothetical protein
MKLTQLFWKDCQMTTQVITKFLVQIPCNQEEKFSCIFWNQCRGLQKYTFFIFWADDKNCYITSWTHTINIFCSLYKICRCIYDLSHIKFHSDFYILVSHPSTLMVLLVAENYKLQMHDTLCPIIIFSLAQKLFQGMDTHSKHVYSKINKTQINMV